MLVTQINRLRGQLGGSVNSRIPSVIALVANINVGEREVCGGTHDARGGRAGDRPKHGNSFGIVMMQRQQNAGGQAPLLCCWG